MINLRGYSVQKAKRATAGGGDYLFPPERAGFDGFSTKPVERDAGAGLCYIAYYDDNGTPDLRNALTSYYYGPYLYSYGLELLENSPPAGPGYIDKDGTTITGLPADFDTLSVYCFYFVIGGPDTDAAAVTELPEGAFCANQYSSTQHRLNYDNGAAKCWLQINSKTKTEKDGIYKLNTRYAATKARRAVNIGRDLTKYEGAYCLNASGAYGGLSVFKNLSDQLGGDYPRRARQPRGNYSASGSIITPAIDLYDSSAAGFALPSISTDHGGHQGASATAAAITFEDPYGQPGSAYSYYQGTTPYSSEPFRPFISSAGERDIFDALFPGYQYPTYGNPTGYAHPSAVLAYILTSEEVIA